MHCSCETRWARTTPCNAALAELLPAPLVTTDARLAAAQGHDAEIELFAP